MPKSETHIYSENVILSKPQWTLKSQNFQSPAQAPAEVMPKVAKTFPLLILSIFLAIFCTFLLLFHALFNIYKTFEPVGLERTSKSRIENLSADSEELTEEFWIICEWRRDFPLTLLSCPCPVYQCKIFIQKSRFPTMNQSPFEFCYCELQLPCVFPLSCFTPISKFDVGHQPAILFALVLLKFLNFLPCYFHLEVEHK